MEMQQMMECLLAKMNANQAKSDTTIREMLTKIDANQENMDAWIAEKGGMAKKTTACREATEVCLKSKEQISLEVEPEEVLKEEAAVENVRALKKRNGDRHLAVRRRGQPKERTQGSGGSQKKLAAACRGMTRSAIPARRKGQGRQVQGEENVARGAPKRSTFGKRRRATPEGITGIRNPSSRQEPWKLKNPHC
jgi:hypothetical protein